MTIVLVVLGLVALLAIILFNSLISRKNQVKNALSSIDAMLKKRFDLIPNLVASVKESMKFESSTLEKVIAMRQQMGPSITPAQASALDQQSSAALRSFFVQVEAYPDLKSSQNLVQMQNALQEVEDQLAAARRAYNSSVTIYNNSLEMFPSSLIAGMMGLQPESLLAASTEEKQNISVSALFKG
jgi:LemA protein